MCRPPAWPPSRQPTHPTSLPQVTNELLKGWVLLRARVQQGEGLPFALEGQTQEFYMLR